ncbi:hypothetical protein [Microbacterium murale]|uniref:Uncharacterized protein n=1 Tax=Microbacterium murale TaxID=1081040 RepID=A0ABQ1RY76_9MICO|nr:hypothetical protein [Microbacterium murale]GGD86723.1 hypothetical protein GCM10007269_32020 [Microbacterium murale]
MKLDDADALLQRVGTIAIMYYPALPADSPGYQLNEDIDWCLDDLAAEHVSAELRDLIGRTVVDPTRHREALTAFVYGTVAGTSPAE